MANYLMVPNQVSTLLVPPYGNQYKVPFCAVPLTSIIKQTWVALQHGMLKYIWVKRLQMTMGCSLMLGCSCPFGSNHQKLTWVARLLMFIWVKPLEIDMGCLVAHIHMGHTIKKQTWVARLLMSIWVKPLEIDMGCSVAHDNVMMCKNIEPTLMGGLLISCSCCSVAFQ